MPPAARITDMHTCPMVTPGVPPVPHVGGPVISGAPTVIVAGMPQARISDQCTCVGPPDVIAKGSPTVIVAGMPAARIGDTTVHGGVIVTGAPNVLIGEAGAGGAGGMSPATPAAVSAPGAGPDAVDRPAEVAASMNQTEFGKRFKTITDMELSDAIDLYEADTGERLDPKTVKTLFTDADEAKELLMKDKDLHTKFRDILNTNIPASEDAAKKAGFEKMPWHKSVFHSPWYKFWQNGKYVSADGHREVVFDPNGNRVDTRKYLGTFNFFGPDQASGHKKADVDPYLKWGN